MLANKKLRNMNILDFKIIPDVKIAKNLAYKYLNIELYMIKFGKENGFQFSMQTLE
jgi:hypothetical protein